VSLPALLLVIFFASLAGRAGIIYTYNGPNFKDFSGNQQTDTTSDRVTGDFTLASELALNQDVVFTPVFFSFNDGYQTLDWHTPGLSDVDFEVILDDPSKSIAAWGIWVEADTQVDSRWISTGTGLNKINGDWVGWVNIAAEIAQAWEVGGYGSWTRQMVVPEPGTLLLVGSGVMGLGRRVRRGRM